MRSTAVKRFGAVFFNRGNFGNLSLNTTSNHELKICLVDDDPSLLKATGRLLSSAGLKAEAFTDPAEFLHYAAQSQPPLAILDIWMPRMNGLDVQKKLGAVSPATKVIVLTSNDDPAVRSRALEAGASAFFLKPAPDDEFLREIESICRNLNGACKSSAGASS